MINIAPQVPGPASRKLHAMTDDLKQLIARLERHPSGYASAQGAGNTAPHLYRASLGIAEIDHALDPAGKRGIPANALHEVRVETGLSAAAGAGFAMALGMTMARAALSSGKEREPQTTRTLPVFWISDDYTRAEYGGFYGPGLDVFGLRADNLIRIRPKDRREALWAAGEIAATANAAAFCLVEINGHPGEIDLTATRRLMLRAQTSRTPVILLRQSGKEEASAAATRWCVSPACSYANRPLRNHFIGPPAFAVTLEKCRGGYACPSTHWIIEWNRDEQRFAPIVPASAGPAASQPSTQPGAQEDATPYRSARAALPFHSPAQTRNRQNHAAKTGLQLVQPEYGRHTTPRYHRKGQ